MNSREIPPAMEANSEAQRKLRWGGVLFALVYPAIITWAYFVLAGRYATSMQQVVYLVVKTIQFGLPIVWVWCVLRQPVRAGRPNRLGLLLGAAFSIVIVAVGWLLFDRMLSDMPVFAGAAELIHQKIGGFGIDSVWKYATLAAFYSLFHSLLEEYYWRWFVFGQLRRLISLWPAIVVSSLAFMAHHVIVLNEFFNDVPWMVWLLSAAVAAGGAFWAWLYERSGSIYAPWLSHLLIDAGIFWIGYDLVREKF